jgi:hypothetical protein
MTSEIYCKCLRDIAAVEGDIFKRSILCRNKLHEKRGCSNGIQKELRQYNQICHTKHFASSHSGAVYPFTQM